MRIQPPPGHTAQTIATACGVHVGSIHRALNSFDEHGVHVCSGSLASSIHHVSKGAIPAWILRPDLWREGQVPPVPDCLAHTLSDLGIAV